MKAYNFVAQESIVIWKCTIDKKDDNHTISDLHSHMKKTSCSCGVYFYNLVKN